MKDTLTLLKTRRSVKPHEMTGPGPTAVELDTLLTIAARVPDHGKLAPWRFIVFEGAGKERAATIIGEAFRKKYPTATDDQVAQERGRFTTAPLIIAVISRAGPHVKIPEWEQVLSSGASAMNLVIAAHAMGFVANWHSEWFGYDRTVLDALGLAPHEKVTGFIHIGRNDAPQEDRPRPALTDVVTRF